jgi:hypothetical protein
MKFLYSLLLLSTLSACTTLPPQTGVESEALIEQQISRMQQGEIGKKEVFLVVVAGFDTPSVFSNEMRLAADQLSVALHAKNRILFLSNSNKDRETLPQVTPFLLQQAVKKLSKKMNSNEDILAMYLVSHGTKQGFVFKANNGYMEIASPYSIQQALKEAETPWNMIFVSACYGGLFVDELKNSKSMVMTAANATNPSFGCDVTNQYTYFGTELLKNRDFSGKVDWNEIFQDTQRKIKKKEADKYLEHSNPQFWLGDELAEYLASLPKSAQTNTQ